MKLTIRHPRFTDKSTISKLYVDDYYECYTLEDKTRAADEPKIFGETAIPAGTYPVTIELSPRFSALAGHPVFLPRLHNVPGYEGVLIHPGNTDADTEGCILVGQSSGVDRIENSRAAFGALFPKLEAAIARGESITLTVER